MSQSIAKMDPTTLNPVAIFLAKKGGGGDRVLFRYPYSAPIVKRSSAEHRNDSGTGKHTQTSSTTSTRRKRNPYALSHRMLTEDPFNQNRYEPGQNCSIGGTQILIFSLDPLLVRKN